VGPILPEIYTEVEHKREHTPNICYNIGMIATLTGKVTHKLDSSLVVELGGIGYEVLTIVDDWGAAKLGEVQTFHIYEQIREDAHNLYGFTDPVAKDLFVKLLGVNGVGPKVALST